MIDRNLTQKHYMQILVVLVFFVVALFGLSCKESLPVYTAPTNILALKVSTIEQLNDHAAPPGNQMVRIVFSCENIYEEVFQDSVDIKGTVFIWWKRKPTRVRTISISLANLRERDLISNGKLLLTPGQQVSFETLWNMKGDDSLYFPSEMNFAFLRKRQCWYNTACADPEEFVVETSLNLYDRLGYVVAPATSFIFIGKTYIL